MKLLRTFASLGAACFAALLAAQELNPDPVVRSLKDRAARGTLSDSRQMVRGDTGRWSGRATLQHAPPIERKPQGVSLDDWAEQLADKPFQATTNDDNWLVFRSRQLDDNDRVWVEKIERRGNEFTVVLNEAIWQGRYLKTFTYYELAAVNLGKLPAGEYAVKWQVKPLVFDRFEDPGKPQDNWPRDERPGTAKPVELPAAFSVRKR